jgi:hypothetical protein
VNYPIKFIFLACVMGAPSFAQKLVDPATVAPEFREAAERRRAEQLKQQDCARKANEAKVMARERTSFLLKCMEEADAAK